MALSDDVVIRRSPDGELEVRLGVPLLDDYLEFVAARCRPNTVLAVAFDLKVFFSIVGKAPAAVTSSDVIAFISAQRAGGDGRTIRQVDDEQSLSARTVARRLSSVSGLFSYLLACGEVLANPVPRGLPTRREWSRPRQTVPLVRRPRTLPRILSPVEVNDLLVALRTDRDRAMVTAMLLGGLRRSEVLGLRLADIDVGRRRVFIADGKGGRQRLVSVSRRFFVHLADYLDRERPDTGHDAVFVVLKGPRRGHPLTAYGLDEVLDCARWRAKLTHGTCHELRHTCLTRLREAGMALEAVQAQAGHASIETTRVYLHLADDWLAAQYRRAAEAIDAQILVDHPSMRISR
ncbi:MAG TPA: tyrosine-type recombinase/integrase [Mycobacteriales bacterium]|nr:tyrosine-type recombinase/integrase [Mycobacteriales bacterium]